MGLMNDYICEAGNDETLQEDLDYIASSEIPVEALRDSKVLVTGATGLIGVSLVRALLCVNRVRNLNLQVGLVIQKKLTDIKFPFQFESAVLMAAFVELGLIFKECKIVERVNKDDLYILVCALLLGTGLFFSKINGVAEVRSSNYGKYPILFVITACAMTGFVVLISYKIGGNFILEKLGQSSLPILLMHKFPILFFQSVLPKTKFLLEKPDTIDGFLCSFVVTCVSIGICYMGKNIIRSVMPIIIGE